MAVLRLVYLIHVLMIYCCWQCTYAIGSLDAHAHVQDNDSAAAFRNLPCPNAEDIAPCNCTYLKDADAMDMDCTYIADEQQLHNIFHATFPFLKFRKLILGSEHLTTLSDTVFGDVTFEDVRTPHGSGASTSVGPNTFIKSASTLRVLYLYYNKFTDFPFETLSQYKQLSHFSLHDNPLPSFPFIYSETLQELHLGRSAYNEIPPGSLDGLPNLMLLSIPNKHIESLAIALFTSLSKMTTINMYETGLKHLESLQFAVISTAITSIRLEKNNIETVDPDTFKGVQSGQINLSNNKLTILPEATWKPLMVAGVHLKLEGNDLTCGCDVAWLVLEPTYHPLVEDARCHSGEMLVQLDPHFFENFC